ncbi:MAG: radical SAM protein [Candidatus Marinimicrobia bacterium]|nr:radical SAM protein [Candidatus Neomarinimicrobiota bacterium]
MGKPFLFIRLTGCNLRCNYCDTKYAYEEGDFFTVDQLLSKILQYPVRNVEITGGEPLLQEDTIELARKIINRGYELLIETNGSLSLAELPEETVKVVDVKTPGSGEEGTFLLENLKLLHTRDNLKFVISDRTDFDWSVNFCRQHNLFRATEILFAAVKDRLDYASLCDWILTEGLDVRFQPQLHKMIWPEKTRGV